MYIIVYIHMFKFLWKLIPKSKITMRTRGVPAQNWTVAWSDRRKTRVIFLSLAAGNTQKCWFYAQHNQFRKFISLTIWLMPSSIALDDVPSVDAPCSRFLPESDRIHVYLFKLYIYIYIYIFMILIIYDIIWKGVT